VLFRELTCTLQRGCAARVLGDNGRGKTTLLRTVAGLRRPLSGQVFWGNIDVHEQPDAYVVDLLFLAHENALHPDLTALENLTVLQKLRQENTQVAKALDDVQIGRARYRPCRQL